VRPRVASSVDEPGRGSEGGGVADENCGLLRESATKGWGAPVDSLALAILVVRLCRDPSFLLGCSVKSLSIPGASVDPFQAARQFQST
jgi:hypothetical protein